MCGQSKKARWHNLKGDNIDLVADLSFCFISFLNIFLTVSAGHVLLQFIIFLIFKPCISWMVGSQGAGL